MKRKVRPKFWIDFKHYGSKMSVGIECNISVLTCDGHFVALTEPLRAKSEWPHNAPEYLQTIVDVLNKYHPPVEVVEGEER